MGIQNNTPTVTWLSITGTTITYNNVIYSVEDIKTNKEYIYWETTNPYKFRMTDDDLGVSGTRYLVFKNNRGEGIKVPNDSILVTFDGNTSKIAEDEIFGLIEKVGVHDGKFVNVIKDIDGIQQNVGAWNVTENGTISENISTIKETSTNIDLAVKETMKQFNEEKSSSRLRDNINKALIDFNSEIGILSSKFYEFSKNSVIDSEENIYISTQLTLLDSRVSEVNFRIEEVIALADTQGQITQKNAIISEKDKLNTTYMNLKNYISSAISDGVTTPTDIVGIVNLLSNCNTDVTTLKNTVDDFIFLGSGGKILEELGKISVKSDEIILSVSNSEEVLKTVLGIEKNILQGQVTDYKNANYKLKSKISEVSIDDIASELEKTALATEITKVDTERADITTKYNELYNNARISTDVKNALKIEYDLFNNKCIETNTKINSAVLDEFINSAEKNEIDTLLNESISRVISLQGKMCQAMDDIDKNTVSWNLAQEKLALQQEISDVSGLIDSLSDTMNGAFKDGVLSDSEKGAIKQNLQTIGNEKSEVDKQHSTVYANASLLGTAKTNLLTAYNNYNTNYAALVTAINTILNKVGLVDSTDQTNLTTAFTNHRSTSGIYSQRLNEAIDSIASKKATDAETNAKSHTDASVTILNDSINLKVSNNSVISAINLSTEGIKINASKIDITGFVTFSSLSTAGQTTINAGNITTGTLNASLLNGGTITAMDEIRFRDGARITKLSHWTGYYGIEISAPAITLGGNSYWSISESGVASFATSLSSKIITIDSTIILQTKQLYSPYSRNSVYRDSLKLGNVYMMNGVSTDIHFITNIGSACDVYGQFRGNFTNVSVSSIESEESIEQQLAQESFSRIEENGGMTIDLMGATMDVYKRNKELEKENVILKQIQSEQDEFLVENAYNLALIKLT